MRRSASARCSAFPRRGPLRRKPHPFPVDDAVLPGFAAQCPVLFGTSLVASRASVFLLETRLVATAFMSDCAARSWAKARADCARASASSSCINNCPFLTRSPSFTSTRLTLVATGACASKLCSGSTFPLVETTLRIFPCSTRATRTETVSFRMETKAPSSKTAMATPTIHINHRRLLLRFEVFTFYSQASREQCTTGDCRSSIRPCSLTT